MFRRERPGLRTIKVEEVESVKTVEATKES
jgi:hypothetical protein